MLLRRLKYPNTTGLILRRTFPELYKSHIIKMFEEYPQLNQFYRSQSKEYIFPNGSRLFFGSAPNEGDIGKNFSSEYSDIMPDEAQEFTQQELEKLGGSNRCTSNSDITPKMVCTFMPGMSESNLPPRGLTYLKRVFADGILQGEEKTRQWAFIQAFSWDNIEWARKELGWHRGGTDRDWVAGPNAITEQQFYSWPEERRRDFFINETEYGKNLAALTDADLRDAWLYGKWNVFKGQYFPRFSHERHVISRAEAQDRIKPWHSFWLWGDWGYDHPHCVHLSVIDERNHVITFRELWGREIGETELGKRITEICAGRKIKSFPFSWDAGKLSPRSMPNVPKSMMQLVADGMGPGMTKPHPADSRAGTRVSGARLMSQLLDSDMWQIVREDCPKLIECIPTLIRDPENSEDVLKVDWIENGIGDDPYDSARMGLQEMLGGVVKPARVVLEEKLQAVRQGWVPEVKIAKPGEVDFFSRFGGKKC